MFQCSLNNDHALRPPCRSIPDEATSTDPPIDTRETVAQTAEVPPRWKRQLADQETVRSREPDEATIAGFCFAMMAVIVLIRVALDQFAQFL